MRIVLVHNYYQQAGGEDRVLRDEEQLLLERGHDVVRFTRHNDAVNVVSKMRLAAGTIWNRRASRELGKLVQNHAAEVVHFHNTMPLISPAAYYGAREAGAAVVQSLHNYRMICPKSTFFRNGTVCEQCLGKFFPWPAVAHGCYRDNRSASAALGAMLATHRAIGTYRRMVDRYIAMTNFACTKLIQGGLPAEKIDLKPNFVSPDLGVGSGEGGYAMYLGRLSPEKGIDTLLEAWQMLPRTVPLKIVGSGPMAEFVRDAAERDQSIELLSGLSNSEVEQLMGEAEMLVLPSVNYEGFPKTIVEAFSKGTPVIASRLGSMAEVIEDGRTGLHFPAGNPAELAVKVTELFGDQSRLAAMREAAREEYEAKYTADRNYELLMAVYERALEARHNNTVEPLDENEEAHPETFELTPPGDWPELSDAEESAETCAASAR